MLNHAGVCVSYWSAWKYLRALTNEALYIERVRTDHWIWVFDNLNFQKHVRHERQGMARDNPPQGVYTRVCVCVWMDGWSGGGASGGCCHT